MIELNNTYYPVLSQIENEQAIKFVRDTFTELLFEKRWNLVRTSAPLFIESGKCINDDLAGTSTPVSFNSNEIQLEFVQSLAKWKRLKLYDFDMHRYEGIYTNMNAIRAHEEMDNLHSIYVDQWDWEMVLGYRDRNITTLKKHVRDIFDNIKKTEILLCSRFTKLIPQLPNTVKFFTTYELDEDYYGKTQKEIEYIITKEHKAVFIIGMDNKYGRASDYDDWLLNGDLLIWSNILEAPIEITSMGIRVNRESLSEQLIKSNEEYKREFDYHKMILNNELPITMGGGIGQSRLCMLLLQKAHIGEVQCSNWDIINKEYCEKNNIELLK